MNHYQYKIESKKCYNQDIISVNTSYTQLESFLPDRYGDKSAQAGSWKKQKSRHRGLAVQVSFTDTTSSPVPWVLSDDVEQCVPHAAPGAFTCIHFHLIFISTWEVDMMIYFQQMRKLKLKETKILICCKSYKFNY